jgi:uncharacterized protein (TIGR00251 family)
MSAVEPALTGWFYGCIFSLRPAATASLVYMATSLKVAITAPPVDGQANAHLTKYLPKQFRVAKSQVIIEKGELGRINR